MRKKLHTETKYIPVPKDQEFFQSHDLGLVAFLLCAGYEMEAMDKSLRNKVLFILKRGDGIDEAAKNYWSFKAPVDAQSYFNQMKRLKNEIFSYE
jgi:hypothetical protein